MGFKELFTKKKEGRTGVVNLTQSSARAPPEQLTSQAVHLRNRGDELMNQKDFATAIIMYNEALRLQPQDVSLLIQCSIACILSDPLRLDEALSKVETATRCAPTYWRAWYQRGEVLRLMGNNIEAQKSLYEAEQFSSGLDKTTVLQALASLRQHARVSSPSILLPPISSGSESQVPSLATVTPNLNSNLSVSPSFTPSSTPVSMTAPLMPPNGQPAVCPTPPSNSQQAPVSAHSQMASANEFSTPTPHHVVQNSPLVSFSTPSISPITPSISVSQPSAPQSLSTAPPHSTGNITSQLFDTDSTHSGPPPVYTPNLIHSDPAIHSISQAELMSQVGELETWLESRKRGSVTIRHYISTLSCKAVQLLYKGMAQNELTTREIGLPQYVHPSFQWMAVNFKSYPGSTLMDMDCEISPSFQGSTPGCTSITGFSEEYRAYQLSLTPRLNLVLEGSSVLPQVPLQQIVNRLRRLQLLPNVEDNDGLKGMLNLSSLELLSSGFLPGGARLKQIDTLCMSITRSLYDAPSRFIDFSTCENLSLHILGGGTPGSVGLQNFLYQILLGAELLIRIRKVFAEAPASSFASIVTDNISALMLVSSVWMQWIDIREPSPTTQGSPRYVLYSSQRQQQAQGLIRFAEAISWPYVHEVRLYMENFPTDNIVAGTREYGMDDWLFGLVLPGKYFRRRIMCCLVSASASVRRVGNAKYYADGIVVKDKSYWPQRTVLGRVLAGSKSARQVCGWVGPAPAPVGTSPGWVRLHARPVEFRDGADLSSATLLRQLGLEHSGDETSEELVREITDTAQWISPSPPRPAQAGPNVTLKAVHLDPLPRQATISLPGIEYRARLEFEIGGRPVSYSLYSNPVFVAAPPCVGEHVLHRRQAAKYLAGMVPIADLKEKSFNADEVVFIDARGPEEEVVARAWCAERALHAVVRRGRDCCFACCVEVASQGVGLALNVIIWS